MTRYADPQRCPDCLGPIRRGAGSCPHCDLSLQGMTARRLFETLAVADELLRTLRVGEPEAAAVVAAPTGRTQPGVAVRAARGLSAASVPKILLSLGAGCLLIAALVFLAVTWSVMGVAGRTTTLVAFTLTTGGIAGFLARKGLRGGAESLGVVALGLLTLDLFGARNSGWFGDISDSGFMVVQGAVIAVVGAAACLAVRRTPVPKLVGAEIVAAVGVGLVVSGIVDGGWFARSAALVVGVLLASAAAVVVHHLRLVAMATGAAAVAALVWLALLTTSAVRGLANPNAADLWGELEVWPLLASAALVGALALVARFPIEVRVAAGATGQLVLAFAVLLPFTQGTVTDATLAVLAVLLAAAVPAWLAARVWSWASAVTVAVAAAWVGLVTVALSMVAVERIMGAGEALWSGTAVERLPQLSADLPAPWLLPVTVVALFGTAVVLARAVPAVDRMLSPLVELTVVLPITLAATVLATGLYPVPVWLVLGGFLFTATILVGWSLLVHSLTVLATGSALLVAALLVALVDEGTTAVAVAFMVVLSALVHLRWPNLMVRTIAGVWLTGAVAGLVWTSGVILDRPEQWTALVAILVLGALVLAARGHARVGIEGGAAVGALVLAVSGTDAAAYVDQASWVAVYLTATGVLASALALWREDRRLVGWMGGLLLAAATWVRLSDIGVHTPEAYTLPSAIALLVVGLLHLHRNPGSSTMTALSPGLGLALLPSLLWASWEPATLRSTVLGLACLVILLVGLQWRWTAPVAFAAGVGAVLVLRHVTPVSDAVPRWVLIGGAGVILVGLGITWERRIQEARAVLGYVRALR